GETAAGPAQRLGLYLRQLFPQLAHEPRLADAGIAGDRDEHGSTVLRHAVERGAEPPEFRLAADERARKTSDTARAHQRERPNEAPGGHDAGLPLRVDCFRPAELERAANRGDRSPARISPGPAACSSRAAT